MKTYKAEKAIAKLIKNNNTIAYTSKLEKSDNKTLKKFVKASDSFDFERLGKDLFPTKSILVSSVCNKNDDVFTKDELWTARHTPLFHPTNIDHDEKKIVGSMIGVYAINDEFEIIDDDTDINDVPDLFHLVNSSVIYTVWQDEDFREEVANLIESIKAGEKYVSMECVFNDFDYGLIKQDGSCHILARDEDTAFLTKHLRAYGGDGKYEDMRVVRVLRNFSFSAKGYVDKPANPDSIIFTNDDIENFSLAKIIEKNTFLEKSGVQSSCNDTYISKSGDNKMSEALEKRIEKMEADIKAKDQLVDDLKNQLSEANVTSFKEKASSLEEELTQVKEVVKTQAEEIKNLKASIEEKDASLKTTAEELEAVKTAKAELEAGQIKVARKDELVSAGIALEDAKAMVEKFAKLDDETWKSVAELAIEKHKAASEKMMTDEEKKKMKEKEKAKKDCKAHIEPETDPAESAAEAANLDDQEPETDPNLASAGVTIEEQEEIEGLQSAMASLMGIKSKGE